MHDIGNFIEVLCVHFRVCMDTSIYKNKEIESFLESEYMNIQEGESRILEFLKKREGCRQDGF